MNFLNWTNYNINRKSNNASWNLICPPLLIFTVHQASIYLFLLFSLIKIQSFSNLYECDLNLKSIIFNTRHFTSKIKTFAYNGAWWVGAQRQAHAELKKFKESILSNCGQTRKKCWPVHDSARNDLLAFYTQFSTHQFIYYFFFFNLMVLTIYL